MIFALIFAILFLVWFIAFLKTNDLSVPTRTIKNFKNILIIYPHPDDEALSVSGLIQQARRNKIKTSLLVLTKGGAGESSFPLAEDLSKVREKEMRESARILGIDTLIQLDYPDGKIRKYKVEVSKEIEKYITKIKPDLVITYDLSGLYGHEDHIVVSEIVTNFAKKKCKKCALWYMSLPQKVIDMIGLPTHMAKNKKVFEKRMLPSHKLFIGTDFVYAYKAVKAHKTQSDSFKSDNFPYIPLIVQYSTQIYEYFYEV